MPECRYDYYLWREFIPGDTEQQVFDDAALIFREFSRCDRVGLYRLSVRVNDDQHGRLTLLA